MDRVGWQAAQPGLMPRGIYWRPQQSLPGPKVPAGVEQHGSSVVLIYTEHLLQGEGRNTLKHSKFRWWSSLGSPGSPAARVSRPWQRAESQGRTLPREREGRRGVGWCPSTSCEWPARAAILGCILTLVGCTQQQTCCSPARGDAPRHQGSWGPRLKGLCMSPLSGP